VLEAASHVGGRLTTKKIDGFTLDRGFQVLFTAYPAAQDILDLKSLDLRRFGRGAHVFDGTQNHRIEPSNPLALAASPLIGLADKGKLVDWTLDCMGLSPEQIQRLPDVTAERAFRQLGFSHQFLDQFARPFFGAVFMDRSLGMSRRAAAYTWKMLAQGHAAVPAAGMQAIPEQLAAGIDVRLGARVTELTGQRRVEGVRLESGERVAAEYVVVATDGPSAESLTGFSMPKSWRSQTCLHFEAPTAPVDAPLVCLRSGPGTVDLVVPASLAAPEYAPYERHLVSATVIGLDNRPDAELAAAVKDEVAGWFPERRVSEWRLLGVDRIAHAVYEQPPGYGRSLPSNTPGRDNLYLAGEVTTASSIEGAMESGDECARLIQQDMSGVPA
jgi:phytoene dehydrogenase-like protein